jgi:type IV secretion system protein VirD4
MTPQRQPQHWGPTPAGRSSSRARRWLSLAVFFGLLGMPNTPAVIIPVFTLIGLIVAYRLSTDVRDIRAWLATRHGASPGASRTVSLPSVRAQVARDGGGAVLGTTDRRAWRLSRSERGVLVLGPPRSGKSSGLIIPTVLTCPGPVVSTSTKRDILTATAAARSQIGRVWEFDPTGRTTASARSLRWSPVTCARGWDGALMMARAMVTGGGVGAGTTDASHWAKRAGALLAALLHAAAVGERTIGDVVEWVFGHELDAPGRLLALHDAPLADRVLMGLANTEARERSSIFSAAADALEAYTGQGALAAATDPNFDADQFVRSTDAVYIHAPAEYQALAAPLVCGLLSEIRRATYHAHATGRLPERVLFALDEAANIAPLAELPQIASEGGGQGLALIAAFQDLSQARHRWGQLADGFLTLFGEKLILPGVGDPRTLEAVSLALGEYDRPVISHTRNPTRHGTPFGGVSRTTSTQRQRVLSPGEIANIPTGRGLHLDGLAWELLTLVNTHRNEPWRTLTQPTPRAGAASTR